MSRSSERSYTKKVFTDKKKINKIKNEKNKYLIVIPIHCLFHSESKKKQ